MNVKKIVSSILGISGTIITGCLVKKRLSSKSSSTDISNIADTAQQVVEVCAEIEPSQMKFTPTQLGDLAHMSAQAINKLLTEKGFQVRHPSGEYILTELGKKFGKNSEIKVTKGGHSFVNIEWAKEVLDKLCPSK